LQLSPNTGGGPTKKGGKAKAKAKKGKGAAAEEDAAGAAAALGAIPTSVLMR
jgi:hypothetical protein